MGTKIGVNTKKYCGVIKLKKNQWYYKTSWEKSGGSFILYINIVLYLFNGDEV